MATQKLSSDIDRMLEQYLQLLDTYTSLRSQLSVLQSSVRLPFPPTSQSPTAQKKFTC